MVTQAHGGPSPHAQKEVTEDCGAAGNRRGLFPECAPDAYDATGTPGPETFVPHAYDGGSTCGTRRRPACCRPRPGTVRTLQPLERESDGPARAAYRGGGGSGVYPGDVPGAR